MQQFVINCCILIYTLYIGANKKYLIAKFIFLYIFQLRLNKAGSVYFMIFYFRRRYPYKFTSKKIWSLSSWSIPRYRFVI